MSYQRFLICQKKIKQVTVEEELCQLSEIGCTSTETSNPLQNQTGTTGIPKEFHYKNKLVFIDRSRLL